MDYNNDLLFFVIFLVMKASVLEMDSVYMDRSPYRFLPTKICNIWILHGLGDDRRDIILNVVPKKKKAVEVEKNYDFVYVE